MVYGNMLNANCLDKKVTEEVSQENTSPQIIDNRTKRRLPTWANVRNGFILKQMCSKRLVAALPLWLPHYEVRFDTLDESTRSKLMKIEISPASIDRLCKPVGCDIQGVYPGQAGHAAEESNPDSHGALGYQGGPAHE
jgi:hypothetical protein